MTKWNLLFKSFYHLFTLTCENEDFVIQTLHHGKQKKKEKILKKKLPNHPPDKIPTLFQVPHLLLLLLLLFNRNNKNKMK